MTCMECGKKPPIATTADAHVDWGTVLRVEHGWMELWWGKAMRGLLCSTACFKTFARVMSPQIGLRETT